MTTGTPTLEQHGHPGATRSATLVWIDSREAFIVRWLAGEGKVERIESDVPVHHRSTAHARHASGRGQSAGGGPQAPVESHRLEHLARFVAAVADKLPEEDLIILGPGTVREHLVNRVEELDARHHRARHIACRAARPMTTPQLVARLRAEIGEQPPRKPIARRRRVVRRPARVEIETKAMSEELDEEM